MCTCLVLSCLFSHPSSRHKIQDFLCGTSYNATLGPPPIFPFSPPTLQGSGCHSMFPVTTLLVPSFAVSPNLPLSIRPKHRGRHKLASALQWFCWGWKRWHLIKFELDETTWGRSGRHGGAKIISITCCMTCYKTTHSLFDD